MNFILKVGKTILKPIIVYTDSVLHYFTEYQHVIWEQNVIGYHVIGIEVSVLPLF